MYLPLKGAAKGGGQVYHDVHIGVSGADLLVSFQRLFVGAVDVGLVVAGAQRDNVANLAQAQLIGVLRAAQVGHQSKQVQIGVLLQYHLGHSLGVCQLRDGLGADERSIFDVLHTGGDQTVDDVQLDLRGDGRRALHALETIAGTNFDDFDLLTHNHPAFFLCIVSDNAP